MQKEYRQQGSVTVFLTITFLLFFAMIGITFENVRVISAQGYVRMAAHAAAMTTFGNYNLELYQEYGLFAYGGFDGLDETALENELLHNLEENIKSAPQETNKNYADLYRLVITGYEVQKSRKLTDSDIFSEQVSAFVKAKAIQDITQEVKNKISDITENDTLQSKLAVAQDFEEGKYDAETEASEGNKETKQQENKQEQSAEKDSAGGNPLTFFSEMIKTGILSLVCDSEKLSDGIIDVIQEDDTEFSQGESNESTEEGSNAARYFNKLFQEVRNEDISIAKQGIKKTELVCYANQQFASYIKELERTTKYGLEYLAAGKEKERDNLSAVVNRLLTLRTLLNLAYVITDTELQNKSMATATVLAGFTGLTPVIHAVQYTILVILAFQEACVDVTALLEGRGVPVVKGAADFKMKYEEICMASKTLFASKAKQYCKAEENKAVSTEISYQQYLWFLLMLQSEKNLQNRMFHLIQYDLRERYNQSFCIQDCICRGTYTVSYQIPYSFNSLPFVSLQEEWNVGTKSLEVEYGYKSQ